MRALVLFFALTLMALGNQYTFLVNKYDKETELEAKIVSKIARSSLETKEPMLYIPQISQSDKEIYSQFFKLSSSCENANFVFVKKSVDVTQECKKEDKLFFTNNYQKLLLDNRYFGAFFWNKSRPNIVFIKERLEDKKVALPHEYEQFIEDF